MTMTMTMDDFERLEIGEAGTFRLVPESSLHSLLRAQAMLGGVESTLTLGRLVRIHCAIQGLTLTELSREIGVERANISNLANDKLKGNPKRKTMKKLVDRLGPGFSYGLSLIKSANA